MDSLGLSQVGENSFLYAQDLCRAAWTCVLGGQEERLAISKISLPLFPFNRLSSYCLFLYLCFLYFCDSRAGGSEDKIDLN